VWYLRQAKILDVTKISPPALTAMTLLVAESKSGELSPKATVAKFAIVQLQFITKLKLSK
jgi:hypothetical protein